MRAYKEVLKEMEFLEYGPKEPEMEPIENCLESVEDISWESDLIRKYMKEYLGVRLWNRLTVLTDMEFQVVYAKVYRQLTFAEIGNILREKPGKNCRYLFLCPQKDKVLRGLISGIVSNIFALY